MARRASSFMKAIAIALFALFGVIALAISYQAFTRGTDYRSKAAEEEVVYTFWEFNGTKEGWEAIGQNTLLVSAGKLTLSIIATRDIASLETNVQPKVKVPKGKKYIKLSMAVGGFFEEDVSLRLTPTPSPYQETTPPKRGLRGVVQGTMSDDLEPPRSVNGKTICALDAQQCPDGSYVGRWGPQCQFLPCQTKPGASPPQPKERTLTAALYYKLSGTTTWQEPISFQMAADGNFRDYLVLLPEIDEISLDRLRISFIQGFFSGDQISVDWIRVAGVPLATPTPICAKRPACFDARPACKLPEPAEGWCPPTPTTTTPVPATPPPPLPPPTDVLSDLTFDGSIMVGESRDNSRERQLIVTIINRGLIAAYAYASYTSQADGVSTVNPANTCRNDTVLGPGDTCLFAYGFTFPTSGSKIMTIRLDPNDQISERNETNNEMSTTLNVR